MPVLALRCPDCGHEFRSLVLAGTRMPEIWDCSQCGGERAAPVAGAPQAVHPWEQTRQQDPSEHRPVYGCMCCF
jgi:hypothetical protein